MIDITGTTRLLGVIANPIKHSLSPMIHNLAIDHLNIDARYLAFEVSESNLESAMMSIRALDMLGVNISMPYKTKVIPYLDELTDRAKVIGAVNTVMNQSGQLIGDNTDGIGFVNSLKRQQFNLKGAHVVLLGAGGAAKAIMHQLCQESIASLSVFKRHNASFESIQQFGLTLSNHYETEIRIYPYDDHAKMKSVLLQSQLIINATNIGMDASSSDLPIPDINVLKPEQTVVDLIYNPRKTAFLVEAEKRGCQTFNGLGMLIFQAADSFESWTNQEMPIQKLWDTIWRQAYENLDKK